MAEAALLTVGGAADVAEAEADGDAALIERLPRLIMALGWVEASAGAAAAILDLSATGCHWPLGDPASPDFRYCAEAVASGVTKSRYCPNHLSGAYTAPRAKAPTAKMVLRWRRPSILRRSKSMT